jgi:hypothetical protein
MSLRIIAVDWSGALSGASDKIWLAEVDAASRNVVRLESGRNRTALADHLIAEAKTNSEIVAGIDFAFSLPGWFHRDRDLEDGPALWALAERDGEKWLTECAPPFWGRPGTTRPALPEHFRRADREVPAVDGIRPKSVFQIGGAGAVGTGSIRGMPVLLRLRNAGFRVWPFDPPAFPLLVEIYPRSLTGSIAKSNPEERRRYLEERYPELDGRCMERAAGSDDAFDALISALVMAEHANQFTTLESARDEADRIEGRIWIPMGNAGADRRVTVETITRGPNTRQPRGANVTSTTESDTSRTGVAIAHDFRDNLIIDRYDPVFSDMRGLKVKHLHSANSEDAVTWNVFRSLRQIAPTVWLPELWAKAFPSHAAPSDLSALVHLWTSVEPPFALLAGGDEGPSEIDIVIETPTWVWFMEAKYRSDISSGTTTRPTRDQILRNIDVGSHYAGVRRFFFSLLVASEHRSPHGLERVREYSDFSIVRSALREHRPDGLANLVGVGSLAWRDLGAVLRHSAASSARKDEQEYAGRALKWLEDKGLTS